MVGRPLCLLTDLSHISGSSSLTTQYICANLFAAQARGLEPSNGQWSPLTRIVCVFDTVRGQRAFGFYGLEFVRKL